eukprot:SAG11_NODE_3366_length_2493_cov_13.732247_1_plen_77_part_10
MLRYLHDIVLYPNRHLGVLLFTPTPGPKLLGHGTKIRYIGSRGTDSVPQAKVRCLDRNFWAMVRKFGISRVRRYRLG